MNRTPLITARDILHKSKKIGIKIGTDSIMKNGDVDKEFIAGLVKSVVFLKQQGIEVVLITSGAIGVGAHYMSQILGQKIDRKKLDIEEKQKASMIGQPILMAHLSLEFAQHGYLAGQGLTDHHDIVGSHPVEHFKKACLALQNDRLGLNKLFVPILNENDAMAVAEIIHGDNDILSGLITNILNLDVLILGSDIKGLHLINPKREPDRSKNPVVKIVKDYNYAMSLVDDFEGSTSNGGGDSKVLAAILASNVNAPMILAQARGNPHFIQHLWDGDIDVCTVFTPPEDHRRIMIPDKYKEFLLSC